jgi:hypothetical protein
MTLKAFHTLIMGEIAGLTDIQKINMAANRVIRHLNTVLTARKEMVLAMQAASAETGFTWDSTNKTLKMPSNIKRVEKVVIQDTSTLLKTDFDLMPDEYVENEDNDEKNVFYFLTYNTLQFARENAYVGVTGYNVEIHGLETLGTIDNDPASSNKIDVPEIWEELILAGTMKHLTLAGKYKDEDVYRMNSKLYNQLMGAVEENEALAEPMSDSGSSYNYHKPGN